MFSVLWEDPISPGEHFTTAEYFLMESDREFAAGEQLQASEKLWGAAAHCVIAVAQQRGWPNTKHGHLKAAVKRLSTSFDGQSLRDGFSAAERFHANFYHDFMDSIQFELDHPAAYRFVERVLTLSN